MIWFIADTHFYHHNLVLYEGRPPWIDAHMIYLWNQRVSRADTVWHLGDLVMGRHDAIPQLIQTLNGQIHLIMGNHDWYRHGWYKRAGVQTYPRPILREFDGLGTVLLSHKPKDTLVDMLNLHGHSHSGRPRMLGNHVNLSVEVRNWRPWSLEELINERL